MGKVPRESEAWEGNSLEQTLGFIDGWSYVLSTVLTSQKHGFPIGVKSQNIYSKLYQVKLWSPRHIFIY